MCSICRGDQLHTFLDLGSQPNGNSYPSFGELYSEPFYPFAMAVCKECWQVQIEEFPDVDAMFSNHPYITGVNMPVVEHFKRLVIDTLEKFPMPKNGLVIDIGANDGTLLKCFQSAGMRTLGIDPGKRTGHLAKQNAITVCETFWDENSAQAIKTLNLRPDLITATAVFYHVADIHSFVRGLKEVMGNKTIFMTQCVYLKDVLEKLQFDHFYHEHTMIHSLGPLDKLFGEYGLRMLDVEHYDVHGGSFVLWVGRDDSPFPTSETISEWKARELVAGMHSLGTYEQFSQKVKKNRDDLVKMLINFRSNGKRIFGLGAPLKGSTLLNFCNIGPDLVEACTEINSFKIGKFTPGTHIPIVYEGSVEVQPDYYLVLSWNFLEFFVTKMRDYLESGGKFIIPHPEVRVIECEHGGVGR